MDSCPLPEPDALILLLLDIRTPGSMAFKLGGSYQDPHPSPNPQALGLGLGVTPLAPLVLRPLDSD